MSCKEPNYAPSKQFKPDGMPNPNYDPGYVKPTPSPPPPASVNKIEWVGKLSSVSLGPDDVLVLMYPKRLGNQSYHRLDEMLARHFPEHEHVILEDGAVLGVVGQGKDRKVNPNSMPHG